MTRPHRRRPPLTPVVLVAWALVLLVCQGCTGAQHASASANDTVLRTARLAGYPDAEVGADRSEAALDLWLPAATSAADIELAWQTGMAALSVAYPNARSYRTVARTGDATLVSATGRGNGVRRAVDDDDPAALRKALTFELLSDVKNPGELVPHNDGGRAQSRQVELDAANRAAGLATHAGPAVEDAMALTAAWKAAYATAPGVPAPSGGPQEAARFAAQRIERALASGATDGAKALKGFVPDLVAQQDVALLREWAAATEAVAHSGPLASVLALTASATREVAAAVREDGQNGSGTPTSTAVAEFDPAPKLDATGSPNATGTVGATLARHGVTREGLVGLAWRTNEASPTAFAGARVWKAFRDPDGAIYWMPNGVGDVALTDTSQKGWGYQIPSAALVDAHDVSRRYESYPLGGTR